MSLTEDLLEQAEHLANRDARRPKQANLRRAISTAYYALFHYLIRETYSKLVSNPALRNLTARAFDHADMKKACKSFANSQLAESLADAAGLTSRAVPTDLQRIAKAFVELQEARHLADYNIAESFSRTDTRKHIQTARDAFAAWERVKQLPVTQVFLVALLVGNRWNR